MADQHVHDDMRQAAKKRRTNDGQALDVTAPGTMQPSTMDDAPMHDAATTTKRNSQSVAHDGDDGSDKAADADDDLDLSSFFPDSQILRPHPDPAVYQHVKREPFRAAVQKNDIYIASRSVKPALLRRIRKLLTRDISHQHSRPIIGDTTPATGPTTVSLHALGRCINLAVDVAMDAQKEFYGFLHVETVTSSVPLVDDFVPRDPSAGLPTLTQVRYNSAIHIRLTLMSP
jgi:hypothetical protein